MIGERSLPLTGPSNTHANDMAGFVYVGYTCDDFPETGQQQQIDRRPERSLGLPMYLENLR